MAGFLGCLLEQKKYSWAESSVNWLGPETGSRLEEKEYSWGEPMPDWLKPVLEKEAIRDPVLDGTWLYRLGNTRGFIAANTIVGGILIFTAPLLLVPNKRWLSVGTLCLVVYAGVVSLAINYRMRGFFREKQPSVWLQTLLATLSSSFATFITTLYDDSLKYVFGLAFVAVAWFSLIMVAQPSCDYGTMAFFGFMPLQLAVTHYRKRFRWIYLAWAFLPVVFYFCQYYFVRYVDAVYEFKNIKRRKRENEDTREVTDVLRIDIE